MSQWKKRSKTEFIVIHCAATPPSMDIGRKEIDRWHRAKGWLGVGYHYIIRRDGTVEEGRPQDAVGAHVTGRNSSTLGICLVGGVKDKDLITPEANYTPEQYESLKVLVAKVKQSYPDARVRGHRDFAPKSCPCFDVRTLYPEDY